jgi:hypothetical protein
MIGCAKHDYRGKNGHTAMLFSSYDATLTSDFVCDKLTNVTRQVIVNIIE